MSFNNGPRQIVESMGEIDLVKISSYGPQKENPDVVLLSPHGGSSRQLVRKLNGSFDDDPTTLEAYLRIDADTGANELAHGVAQEIVAISGDLRVDVVQVLFERGLVDPNRVVGFANRNVLSYGQIGAHGSLLRQVHAEAISVIDQSLAGIGKKGEKGGIFFDIHSMASHTPKHLEGEQPGHLKAYNFAYGSRSQRGARRFFDLITDIPGEGMIASPIVFRNVANALTDRRVSFRQNNPYPRPGYPARNVRSTWHMVNYSGLALDLPKDSLSKGVAEDAGWDIANLEIDHGKVERMAKILAGAAIQSLREIRL